MLAFGLLGMVLAATYTLSVRSMRHQIEAKQNYELTSMARALLDEHVLTYPAMASSGTYKNTWDWQIKETPQAVLEPTQYDSYFRFVRITAKVKIGAANSEAFELFTVVARRGSGI
jgi:type II secretory pathway pseudopilin PulG